MKSIRVGIDNYGLLPLNLTPMETIVWASDHGAEGVHFSGLTPEQRRALDATVLKDLGQAAASEGLYIEWGGAQHIPFDTTSWQARDVFSVTRQAAEEAKQVGACIVRSCSGGLMRWKAENPTTEQLLEATAESLVRMRPMLEDLDVTLAIEIHFEFTTHEIVRLFDRCGAEPGGPIGICLDSMNLLVMMEDPVSATQRILPWIVATHIKDGGILLHPEGMTAFPSQIGRGCIDLKAVIQHLMRCSRDVNLSIEDHGGAFFLPVFDPFFLSRFPDLTPRDILRMVDMAQHISPSSGTEEDLITPREQWPERCEARLSADIAALKKIVQEIKIL